MTDIDHYIARFGRLIVAQSRNMTLPFLQLPYLALDLVLILILVQLGLISYMLVFEEFINVNRVVVVDMGGDEDGQIVTDVALQVFRFITEQVFFVDGCVESSSTADGN